MTQTPASPPPAAAAPQESKRIACGVLGILLGSLGIHKFLYGATVAGIIMLVVSVVGSVVLFCTFGLPAYAMHVIGLIEGIIYLTKSDAEFVQIYQVGKRAWF